MDDKSDLKIQALEIIIKNLISQATEALSDNKAKEKEIKKFKKQTKKLKEETKKLKKQNKRLNIIIHERENSISELLDENDELRSIKRRRT